MWRRHNPETIESIKKDIKRIRRAGFSAEILGWLLLLFAAAVIWLAATKTDLFILYGTFILIGLFLVYSGKYVKDGRGRRTKYALLANCIITIPLCVGLIPIYVCVKSINNYSRFKDLPENILELYNKPKKLRIDIRDILFLVIVIIIGVGSVGLRVRRLDANAKNASQASQVSSTDDSVSRYGFTISYPGPVSETDFTEQVSGHSVPYTTYDSTGDKGTQDFDVYAYNYPTQFFNYTGLSQSAITSTVHSSLMSVVQGLNGTLVSSTASTYLGHASEEGQFTCLVLGGTITGYIRIFYIGNFEYAIFAKGPTQSDFDNFANSFQYKGI